MKRVDYFKYLGVQITKGLTRTKHTDSVVRKSQQRLFHLRYLREIPSYPDYRLFCSGQEEARLTQNQLRRS